MQATGTLIGPGAGEIIGDAPDRRVELLSDHDAVHATWSRFGPRRNGAGLHVHHRHSDLFFVLAGELTVKLGPEGDEHVAPAGTLARVPPLVVHGFRNGGDAELRYLNFHAPGEGFADYMRGLSDFDQAEPPDDGGRPATEATIGEELFAADGVRLLADVEEIAVAELRRDPDESEPHVHDHVESLYVIEGELTLTAGDEELRAQAGSWLQVPPGVPHRLSFASGARVLDVHTPGSGFGAFLRGARAFDATRLS